MSFWEREEEADDDIALNGYGEASSMEDLKRAVAEARGSSDLPVDS